MDFSLVGVMAVWSQVTSSQHGGGDRGGIALIKATDYMLSTSHQNSSVNYKVIGCYRLERDG